MAASPRQPLLAVGGEDGVIRLFQYDDVNRLFYFKSFPSSGTRVLSLAYHPTEPRLFMGCSDGTIRSFDDVSAPPPPFIYFSVANLTFLCCVDNR
jgi:WD40 repeat protein